MMDVIEVLKGMADYIGSNGRNEYEIDRAEAELHTTFSDDYRKYLKVIGLACFDGHELTGITDISRLDVVSVTTEQRKWTSCSALEWYVVEEANIDGIVLWQSPDGKVYETNSTGNCIKVANSLTEYLLDHSA